jgi:hypothetical protein
VFCSRLSKVRRSEAENRDPEAVLLKPVGQKRDQNNQVNVRLRDQNIGG